MSQIRWFAGKQPLTFLVKSNDIYEFECIARSEVWEFCIKLDKFKEKITDVLQIILQ